MESLQKKIAILIFKCVVWMFMEFVTRLGN